MVRFFFSSKKPISFNCASFILKPSSRLPPMSAPKTFAGLFRGGDVSEPKPPSPEGDVGGLILSCREKTGKVEEVDRKPK